MLYKNEDKRHVRPKGLTRRSIDQPLLLIVLLLVGAGCFFIYDFTAVSAAVPNRSHYLVRQMLYAVCGFAYLWALSRMDYHRLAWLAAPMLIALVGLYIFVYIGPSGWGQRQAPHLASGSLRNPVGELTEAIAILILAKFLASVESGGVRAPFFVCGSVFIWVLPLVFSDYQSALVLLVTVCILLPLIDLKFMLVDIALAIVLYMGRSEFLPIIEPALSTWMDPFSDPQGRGFAAVQSIYAIADGGAFGVGTGYGTVRYATEDAHSTFALPAIVQEVGLIGTVMILLLYMLFLVRAFVIADKAADRFGFYLAAAIMIRYSVLFSLALLASVNLIPRLGNFSLPFLSYGGVSLVIDLMLVGVLLSIGRYQAESARR